MTLSLILASVWAILATALAFLPMRLQFAPGIVLLVLALPLLVFIGVQHGPWIVALGGGDRLDVPPSAGLFRAPPHDADARGSKLMPLSLTDRKSVV